MSDQPVRYAKQDEPWPEDKLPKGTSVLSEEDARNIVRSIAHRPGTHMMKDVALDVEYGEEGWSEKHARILITILWKAIKPGYTLFVPPTFPAFPPVSPKRAHLEGYKQFTK